MNLPYELQVYIDATIKRLSVGPYVTNSDLIKLRSAFYHNCLSGMYSRILSLKPLIEQGNVMIVQEDSILSFLLSEIENSKSALVNRKTLWDLSVDVTSMNLGELLLSYKTMDYIYDRGLDYIDTLIGSSLQKGVLVLLNTMPAEA